MRVDTWSRTSARQAVLPCVATLLLAAGAPAVQAECESEWSRQFAEPGISGVRDSVIWDDGSGRGPALYLAGALNSSTESGIGNAPFYLISSGVYSGPRRIVRWDGTNYSGVGDPLNASNPLSRLSTIYCLTTFDPDGPGGPLKELLVVGGSATSGGSCVIAFDGTTWSNLGGTAIGTGQEVFDLAVYNGQLYAAGRFQAGTSSTSPCNIVRLNAARTGWLTVAGSVPERGTGSGIQAKYCKHLAVGDFDGDGVEELYVSGNFTYVGTFPSVTAAGLAKWNGTAWSAVPGFVSRAHSYLPPSVLQVVDRGEAGGRTLLVGDVTYTGLTEERAALAALSSNGTWSTLLGDVAYPVPAGTLRGYVYAAAMYQNSLHIGGINLAQSLPIWAENASMARLDGMGQWEFYGLPHTIAGYNVGVTGPEPTTDYLAAVDWDFGGAGGVKLLHTGGFDVVAGKIAKNKMILWNGTEFELPHTGTDFLGFNAQVIKELDIDGDGAGPTRLYLAGFSTSVRGEFLGSSIVTFDGTDYHPLPEGVKGVRALDAFTPASGSTSLYAVGNLADNSNANDRVFRFDGSSWESLVGVIRDETLDLDAVALSLDAMTRATIADEPSLIVGGRFRRLDVGNDPGNPNPLDARWVARFNGTAWSAMDAGLPTESSDPNLRLNPVGSRPVSLAVLNGQPFVFISYSRFDFTLSSSTDYSQLYRWNGAAWELLLDLPANVTCTLAVFNTGSGDTLYAMGSFSSLGGVSGVDYFARWNGTAFEAVGSGFQFTGASSSITAAGVHDFGSGPELVVATPLRKPFPVVTALSGGVDVSGLARFDGTSWSRVTGREPYSGGLVTAIYSSSHPDHGGLYLGGGFFIGDGSGGIIESRGIARLVTTCTNPCPADFNGDSTRDVADLFAYINAWLAKTANADFNDSGNVDVADLFAYINAWLAGC